MRTNLIFITGTDTGVGKTLLTGLLLTHLRQQRIPALAIKPFCSGRRDDVRLLQSLQIGELQPDEINPFYFSEPLAPLVATRLHRRSIGLKKVLQHIRFVASHRMASPTLTVAESKTQNSKLKTSPWLLIEGAGGLLVPLGEGYTWADVISKLEGRRVIIVSPNRLGTINHTLLTIRALQNDLKLKSRVTHHPAEAIGASMQDSVRQGLRVVLMAQRTPDPSSPSNPRILAELLSPIPIIQLPFLGANPLQLQALKKDQRKLKKVLARILA